MKRSRTPRPADHDIVTPMLLGTIEESENWTTRGGDSRIRYKTWNGTGMFVNAPVGMLSPKMRGMLYDLFVAFDTEATRA